jgi:hypothetical protein
MALAATVEFLALASEFEELRSPRCVLAQLLVFLVSAPRLATVAGHLSLEFQAPSALPPVDALELTLGGREFLGPAPAELIEGAAQGRWNLLTSNAPLSK